ncbi:MAG TPA: hypothetical protein DIC64_00495 [Alphaproteobacteria bacterium]|nr:hypothetical protein [Alphaproteobacteria bacterium]
MAFDSEGNFTRLHHWENDRLNDIGIVSDRHDEEDDNFANALNNCFLRDGRVPLSGALKMNSNQIKNMAQGTALNDAVTKGQTENLISILKEEIFDLVSANLDLGDIKASVQTENHGCWLLCDGQAVSRSTYAELFDLIGTNFGAGDGVSTFNVPDYRGKFLRGLGGDSEEDIYTTQAEGLPSVPYTRIPQAQNQYDRYGSSGTFPVNNWNYQTVYATTDIYGASEHVTPINQAVNFFIKAKKEA